MFEQALGKIATLQDEKITEGVFMFVNTAAGMSPNHKRYGERKLPGVQPRALSNESVRLLTPSSIITPKMDGRQFVLVHMSLDTLVLSYLCDRRGRVFQLNSPVWDKAFTDIVLDGELVLTSTNQLVYVPFDCTKCFNESLLRENMCERSRIWCNLFVPPESSSTQSEGLCFAMKPFLEGRQFKDMLKYVSNENDEFVCHLQQVVPKGIKPPSSKSTEFKVTTWKLPCDGFVLYQPNGDIYKFKTVHTIDLAYARGKGTNTLDLLAQDDKQHERVLGQVVVTDQLYKTLTAPDCHVKILSCAFQDNKWRVVDVREDKDHPNAWFVIQDTLQVSANPPYLSALVKAFASSNKSVVGQKRAPDAKSREDDEPTAKRDRPAMSCMDQLCELAERHWFKRPEVEFELHLTTPPWAKTDVATMVKTIRAWTKDVKTGWTELTRVKADDYNYTLEDKSTLRETKLRTSSECSYIKKDQIASHVIEVKDSSAGLFRLTVSFKKETTVEESKARLLAAQSKLTLVRFKNRQPFENKQLGIRIDISEITEGADAKQCLTAPIAYEVEVEALHGQRSCADTCREILKMALSLRQASLATSKCAFKAAF